MSAGGNDYIDFSINPEMTCYNKEVEDTSTDEIAAKLKEKYMKDDQATVISVSSAGS